MRLGARKAAFIAAVVTGLPAASAGEVLRLDMALDIALSGNPTVANAKISVDEVGDQIQATRARQFPALSLGAGARHNFLDESFEFRQGSLGTVAGTPVPPSNVDLSTQRDVSGSVSVGAKQPLSGLYKLRLNIDKLKVEDGLARQNLRAKRQDIANRVKEQYYEILETQGSLGATRESVRFYKSLVKVVSDKVKARTALDYELLDTEAKLAQAEHEAFRQRNALKTEKERLNELLGRDVATPFTVTSDLPLKASELTPAAAQALALDQRPEAKMARLELERARVDVDIKESDYLPEVDVRANYNRNLNTEFIPDEAFYVGVIAKWELYTWGRRSDEVSKARRAVGAARNGIRQAEARVVADVNARIRDVNNARNLIGVTQKAQHAARAKLKVVRNKYEHQAALLDNVFKAQSELVDANNAYHKAVLALWTSRANLAKALGEE